MKSAVKNIAEYFLSSFDNHNAGASARKLTAFSLMICIAYLHVKEVHHDNALQFLVVDLCGILICLGIVTAEQIIKFKNGNENSKL